MNLSKILCLLALVSMTYSCSNNALNDEDPTAGLKSELATPDLNASEYVKSDYIAAYLDARAQVLYVLPDYEEVILRYLGTAKIAANRYEISTAQAEGAASRQQFSVVNVNDRAMIHRLSTIRGDAGVPNVSDDDEGPVAGVDYKAYSNHACQLHQSWHGGPCVQVNNGSVKHFMIEYYKCKPGEGVCIEQPNKIVEQTEEWTKDDCTGNVNMVNVFDWFCTIPDEDE